MKNSRMMQKIKVIALFVAVFLSMNAKGQLVNSLYYMDNLPQASRLNPARMPNCNFYISMMNVGTSMFTELGPQHVFTQDNVVNDTLRMPFYNETLWNDFLNKLHDPISLNFETEAGVGFGFRAGRGYFHFDLTERNIVNLNLAKDFLTMNDLGDGVTKDFSTLSMNSTVFMQAGMGYAREINPNLNVGLKLKLLKGLAAATMNISRAELYTSVENWNFSADMVGDISFPVQFDTDVNGDLTANDSVLQNIDFSYVKNYLSPATNFGAAVDFGIEYKVMPQLYLSASLVDLGKIWWNYEVSNITAGGNVQFEGVSEEPILYKDDQQVEDYFQNLGDSLLNELSYGVSHNNFSSGLAPKLYLGAEYLLNDQISFGVLSNTSFYKNKTMESVMFSANANLYHFLTAGAHYGWNWGYANTAGFTFGINIFPLQIYVAADYLPLKYQKVDVTEGNEQVDLGFAKWDYAPIPVNLNALSLQVGLNLKFGCRKRYNEPIYKSKYDEDIPGYREL
ncbi:DUF5723 family protein [Saccharicrinis sp. FJH54]|uniref:DUF5723 family protein n=1 Tax=Saccharicrinis sp. FJH54 TaxID=3344665 RepID=UPI0035D4613A